MSKFNKNDVTYSCFKMAAIHLSLGFAQTIHKFISSARIQLYFNKSWLLSENSATNNMLTVHQLFHRALFQKI